MKTLSEIFGVVIGLIIAGGWFLSLPLAFIYGDKLDVVISLFLPFYGVVVALN